MRLRSLVSISLIALALVGGGCGGGDDEEAEGPPAATTSTDTAAGASGEAVFVDNCGGCHTLAAAGTSGSTGPNLDELRPDAARVEEQVRNGGGGMPAFEGDLSDEQITAVAEYVSASAGG